ncbi:MAG TPA: MMPL family transporter [Gaiellaceae bacterium]
MPARWTRLVLRFRRPIVAAWLVVLVAGALASARLTPLLSNSFGVPGTDSERATTLLARDFGERPDGTFTVVFRVRHPGNRAIRDRLRRRVALAAAVIPGASIGVVRTGGGVVFVDVRTPLDLQHAKRHTDALRRALTGSPRAYVTGQPAIQRDVDRVFVADLRRGEAIAVPLTLLVLLVVFGFSLAVAIPFLVAACAISGTLGAVYLVAHEVSMVSYVRNLIELVGLGLAVDYSLLIVYRFREELAAGGSRDAAVERTMATAGRAVVFSGVAVAIGLGLLVLVPVPFIRSMGLGGLAIPVVSVVAAVTLQPALLSLLGARAVGKRREGRFWGRLAAAIMRRPRTWLATGTVVLLALAIPAVHLHVTPGSLTGIPASTDSVQGYNLLRSGLGGGIVTPTHVVIAPAAPAAANRLVDELTRDRDVLLVATGRRPPYVGDGAQQVIVATRNEWGDAGSRAFVHRLRNVLIPGAHFPNNVRVYAGGAPPQGVDFVDRTYAAFPWLVGAVLLLTLLVLLRAFRSLVLPVKAVALNLLSVAATYGILAAVFDRPIEAWIPVFLFATLFGLSMDYEVFMVSRMREAHDAGRSNTDAVAYGLERTGRVVTAAAAIMVAAFSGFAAGRIEGLRQFGFGLAVAVALDATLVRAILVPSLMGVLGDWNWWLPRRRA